MEYYGKLWKAVESYGKLMEDFRRLWKVIESYGILWKVIECYGKFYPDRLGISVNQESGFAQRMSKETHVQILRILQGHQSNE